MDPVFVIVCGLPGTGKSTFCDAIANRIRAPVFNKDRIEASLWRDGIRADHNSWQIAENLLTTLAGEQLRRHQSAILDTVARSIESRSTWRSLADEHNARLRVIECVCSDERAHRARIEGRERAIPGWYELIWNDVEHVAERYAEWTGDHLVIDAMLPLVENVATVLGYLQVDSGDVAGP